MKLCFLYKESLYFIIFLKRKVKHAYKMQWTLIKVMYCLFAFLFLNLFLVYVFPFRDRLINLGERGPVYYKFRLKSVAVPLSLSTKKKVLDKNIFASV